ncbi:MarR family transcriptional regulator [Streptomyces sp. NPDC004647]|uniref:MarR family winged helix-turn-helix transcriptional regulator n=1 Tax=Streptomyces sp. NPDC004647 TaxID=3154671 RepID=UPI0033B80059
MPQDAGPAEALVDLSHHVLHLFADVGRSHKLSQQQVELVCAVVVRGSVGMTELGGVLHVEKSNLSNLVDRLEQRGLVLRSRDPADRRATQVTLTDDGLDVA